jgi:hypothetical protein
MDSLPEKNIRLSHLRNTLPEKSPQSRRDLMVNRLLVDLICTTPDDPDTTISGRRGVGVELFSIIIFYKHWNPSDSLVVRLKPFDWALSIGMGLNPFLLICVLYWL